MHSDNQQNGSVEDAVYMGAAAQRQMHQEGRVQPVRLLDMVAVMARLAQILAEEVDYLDSMQIKEIEALQDEKRKLTKLLSAMKRDMERSHSHLQDYPEDEVASFNEMAQIFDDVLQENKRKLLVAKEINHRVVQAISDVVEEEAVRPGYDRMGTKSRRREGVPSVSLNERI